ncbi:DUF456 domain-containing protein [Neobacillus sp. SM06]|uniref:DUF456 domain-containing protein n=1 Tax=Neobacillus sp. SM06 TaxID=3422492 RepID=UPI003D2AB176
MLALYWGIIGILFVLAFVGLIYPILPSALFLIGGFLAYGLFFGFSALGWFFWVVEAFFFVLLFGADTIANLIGVKKYGGTKAGMWGSTIGILVGPFVIPIVGIIAGPFIGAALAEMVVHRRSLPESLKVGFGSVIGFITSVLAKIIVQAVMIGYFLFVTL